MKTIRTLLILSALLPFTLCAQVKIITGGRVNVASPENPISGFKLHVRGHTLFSDSLFQGASAAMIRGLSDFSNESEPDYTWYNNDKTGLFHPEEDVIGFTSGGRERMRLSQSGNLLIGGYYDGGYRTAIDADENLSALSTTTRFETEYGYAHCSYVNHETTKNWVVVFNEEERFFVEGNGNVWSYTNYYYSDSILKENIQTLQQAKDKLLQLRGVSYNFKAESLNNPQDSVTILPASQPQQMGFIAEEVEQVLPELVAEDGNGVKGVAYSGIIPLLVEALKSQQAELEDLKAIVQNCCANTIQPGSGNRLSAPDSTVQKQEETAAMLFQNQPNPFHQQTEIRYRLPDRFNSALLMIFDLQGAMLSSYPLQHSGAGSIIIHAESFKPGMYIYSLWVDNDEVDSKKMIITR